MFVQWFLDYGWQLVAGGSVLCFVAVNWIRDVRGE